MSRLLRSTLLMVAAVMSTACVHAIPNDGKTVVTDPTLSPVLDRIAAEGLDEKIYPGAVLIVGQPGRILHAKAYGKRTYAADAPAMTLDTIFDMASVSKVAGTSTESWVLLQDGKIKLEDPVSKYIPGFEANGKDTVTIKDLMTHTSGLKAYENNALVEKERLPEESHADALVRHYAALKPSYEPRSKYLYSCLNFQTMARVNETASGQRMQEFLQAHVWTPMGMKDTGYVLSDEQKTRIAPTHKIKGGAFSTTEIHDPLANYHSVDADHCPGNAGLFSTAPDMARFCEMVLRGGKFEGKQIISSEILAKATVSQTPPGVEEKRGLGWDIYEQPPYMTELNKEPADLVIGHTGYTGTLLWLDKHSKTYFVFLTNRTLLPGVAPKEEEQDVSPLRKKIADAVLHSLPEYSKVFAAAKTAE